MVLNGPDAQTTPLTIKFYKYNKDMKTLFLVSGTISYHSYMSDDGPRREKETRLVMAHDNKEAETLFTEHFTRKSDPYCTSIYCDECTVHETICGP